MADTVYLAIGLGFFGFCAVYVRWCDRIIGDDLYDTNEPQVEELPLVEQVTA
jgi:hypothetical protein